MKFQGITNVQHPTKIHCVWGVDGGKKCNNQFINLFLIDYGEIIHAFRVKNLFAIAHSIFTRKP